MFSDQQLLSRTFDDKAYLRHTLQLSSYDAEHQRLARCIESVEADIAGVVSGDAPQLIESVNALHQTESEVDEIQGTLSAAQSTVQRLRHIVREPYCHVQRTSTELRNATTALDLLRAVHRFLALVAKLKESATSDIARASKILRELEELLADQDLRGVECVEAELPAVSAASQSVRAQATELLRTAMAGGDQVDLSLAVQCFASLGTLGKVVHDTVNERKTKALTVIVKQLNVTALDDGRDKDFALRHIEATLRTVAAHTAAVALLFQTLRRKKDPVTQRAFSDSLAAPCASIAEEYWRTVAEQLREHLVKLTKRGSLHALVAVEYARYHRILVSYGETQRELFLAVAADAATAEQLRRSKVDAWLEGVCADIQQRFEVQVRDRHREKLAALSSKIAAAAPSPGSAGTIVDVVVDPKSGSTGPAAALEQPCRSLIKVLQHDLATNRQDDHVLGVALRSVISTISSATAKVRESAAKDPLPSLPSIAVSATASQLFHIMLSNAASVLATEMTNALANLPRTTSEVVLGLCDEVRSAVSALETVCDGTLRPFFDAARVTLLKHVDTAFDSTGDRPAAIHSRMWHFLTRYVLLFDRQTPGLDGFQKSLVDALLCRCMTRSVVSRTPESEARAKLARELSTMPTTLSPLFPAERLVTRVAQLKYCARLVANEQPIAESEVAAAVRRLHPVVVLFVALQRVPLSSAVSVETAAKQPIARVVEVVDNAVAADALTGCAVLWEAVHRVCLADVADDEVCVGARRAVAALERFVLPQ